jgi:hypothetical protein
VGNEKLKKGDIQSFQQEKRRTEAKVPNVKRGKNPSCINQHNTVEPQEMYSFLNGQDVLVPSNSC